MARVSPRRFVSLVVTVVVLAIPTTVAALTAAPCANCFH
jgi:hypothetical protein